MPTKQILLFLKLNISIKCLFVVASRMLFFMINSYEEYDLSMVGQSRPQWS